MFRCHEVDALPRKWRELVYEYGHTKAVISFYRSGRPLSDALSHVKKARRKAHKAQLKEMKS